jgi:hypothetical protein
MGMYTEILVKAGLKKDLPKEVYDIIDYLFGTGEEPDVLPEHKFFTLPRWRMVGRCSSWYHHPTTVNNIDKTYKDWRIFSRSDLKNYNNEIDTFFGWFRTVIAASEGECIGYSWYEEESQPVLVLM